jgi:hypothetical protein
MRGWRIYQGEDAMKMISMLMLGAMVAGAVTGAGTDTAAGATVASSAKRTVSLVGPPLVMRLNSDEFRIAFGLDGKQCMPAGCSGSILYRVYWKTADGTPGSDSRRVSYQISPHSGRTIAVDRQYLDTAEGAHTTQVVNVNVDRITCQESALTQGS